jgi:hypothetical protein
MSKHSQGPWRVIKSNVWDEVVCDDGHLPFWIGRKSDELLANTYLFASAPDLLAALLNVEKLLIGVSCTDYPVSDELAEVQAAIAKATGECK